MGNFPFLLELFSYQSLANDHYICALSACHDILSNGNGNRYFYVKFLLDFVQGEDYLVEKIIFRQKKFFRHALFKL